MKKYLSPFFAFLLLVILWEISVEFFHIEKFILPAPSLVVGALMASFPLLLEHSLQTAFEALLGFGLAVIMGTCLALAMGMIPWVKRIFYPLIVVSQTVPIMAVAPLLIIWFGYELLPKVLVVALVCFFPITVSTVEGLDNIDQDMVKLLVTMGATPGQILRMVQFPGALPAFFAGLKISATYSILGAVIGEWLGGSKGLGIYMTRSMHSFLTERVFASIVVITAMSLVLVGIVEIFARLAMPWQYQKISWQQDEKL